MMMHKNRKKNEGQIIGVLPELMKDLSCEASINGKWIKLAEISNNLIRLVKMKFAPVETTAIRIKLKETWCAKNVKLFEVRCYS